MLVFISKNNIMTDPQMRTTLNQTPIYIEENR